MYLMAMVHLVTTVPAMASNITNAEYYGTVQVVNNSTAETYVSSNITNISVTSLVDGGFIPSASNTTMAMQNTSGADVAFMPGYTTSAWMTWVSAIPDDGILNYVFYTGNITGGKVRYFPDTTGMTAIDDPTLELAANFTIEQAGYIDTSTGADKYLVEKDDAFTVYISDSSEITAAINSALAGNLTVYWRHQMTNATTGTCRSRPAIYNGTSYKYGDWAAAGAVWTTSSFDWAVNPWTTAAWRTFEIQGLEIGVEIHVAPGVGEGRTVKCSQVYATIDGNTIRPNGQGTATEIESVLPGGSDHWSVVDDTVADDADYVYTYAANPAVDIQKDTYLAEDMDVSRVIATGISSGEHKLQVTADGVDLKIYVDDVEEDTMALGGASVPDVASNWTVIENDVMPYMEYHRMTVGGNLRQYIVWEYDTTFTDQSGNSNDATPSFAVDSSDSDITASLITYQPITEAQAPAYSISDAPDFITTAPNLTATFSDTIAPTVPGADVITDVSASSSTPAQLPWVMIAGFVILVASISTTYILRKFGATSSVFIKLAIIAGLMGASISVGVFDFWMILFFLIISIAIGLASRPQETLG